MIRHPALEEPGVKVEIQINEQIIPAVIDDTPTARAFLQLLPLTLILEDYNGTEMIADLPKRLTIVGAPNGVVPKAGDIAYYAPWGNLAIFYRDFRNSPGLIRLGSIDASTDALRFVGAAKVTIRRSP